jgi:tetratricopeptide (TPR) repeat protein
MALLMAGVATPALAQASIKGRVLNQQKRGVPDADVVATCLTVASVKPAGGITDNEGRFQITGLQFGKWNVVISKGNLIFKNKEPLNLIPGVVTDLGDMVLMPLAGGATAPVANKAESDAHNKKVADIQAKFKSANEDIAAGKFDDAIPKLEAVANGVEKCAPCSAKLGDVYLKKQDLTNAEKYYLQAIEFDAATVDAYTALAMIYNTQRKFDEALKMSAKASESNKAKGGAEDPAAVFNEGIVLWNARKMPEAEAAFKKATELDPKNAAAFYQLGMTQVSQGKNPEAVKSLEAYLKLEPTGKDADTAKAILASIK